NHREIFTLFKKIKKNKPDFIYERLNYLDFKGIIIAKIFKIPHFYEVNGIPHIVVKGYYSSYLNFIIKKLEKFSLSNSNYLFIVGSWQKLLKLKHNNWISIENGI